MRIVFTGKMRSGKDTAAEYLVDKYGGKILKFADPLYQMQVAIYKIAGLTPQKDRKLLQFLGTDWGRDKDPDLWVKIMERTLSIYNNNEETQLKGEGLFLTPPINLFITDARFSNELDCMRYQNFALVRIIRNEQDRVDAGATNLTHESETSLDEFSGFDYTIDNNGTLEEFLEKIDEIYHNVKFRDMA